MKKFRIPKKKREKWINALKSDRYKQTQGILNNNTENTYCCLGVYSKCNRVYEGTCLEYPKYDEVCEVLQNKLVNLNDKERKNFKEIASFIKSNTIGV